jgi:hypothetical protein
MFENGDVYANVLQDINVWTFTDFWMAFNSGGPLMYADVQLYGSWTAQIIGEGMSTSPLDLTK